MAIRQIYKNIDRLKKITPNIEQITHLLLPTQQNNKINEFDELYGDILLSKHSRFHTQHKTIYSGFEIDPRGIPIYALAYINILKEFQNIGYHVISMCADYHSKVIKRPWIIDADRKKLQIVIKQWIALFKAKKLDAVTYFGEKNIKDLKYKEILSMVSNTRSKFKYLPKERRAYYKSSENVPKYEWDYLNLVVSDVLFFEPYIFFSDKPARPQHVAVYEKIKQEPLKQFCQERNIKPPISILSPTVPPLLKDRIAPTFYWLTDFLNRDLIINIKESKESLHHKLFFNFDSVKRNPIALLFIWKYIIFPELGSDPILRIGKKSYLTMDDIIFDYMNNRFRLKDFYNSTELYLLEIIEKYNDIPN